MPKQVQKRKGYQEEFQVEKLRRSIENAAKDAGFPEDKIFQVVEEISSYVLENVKDLESVDTQSMRSLILNKLDESYPEVANAWRKYDKEVKGRED
ncbi:MAG: ATP cone domain-containing protein [Minisyncoccia bacterium]|jgi:transcriptional regulator NrdR family protein